MRQGIAMVTTAARLRGEIMNDKQIYERMNANLDRIGEVSQKMRAMCDRPNTTDSLKDEWGHVPSIDELMPSVRAWKSHVETHELQDRKDFVEWLIEQDKETLAWFIDSEVTRSDVREVYLKAEYGV